jgi:uncharacterized protein (TIGR03437 family)
LDGRVLVIGGTIGGVASQAVEAFDPAAKTTISNGAMSIARTGFTATAMRDGTVLIAGGKNSSGQTLSSVELYDPNSGTSSMLGEMTSARHNHSAVLLPNNNQILIAGGANGDMALDSAEVFTPWTRSFSRTGSLSTARQGASQMIVRRPGLAQIIGGANATGPVAGTESYGYATIQSGKAAYGKGENVSVSGDGWAAGAPVKLTFAAINDPQKRTSPFVTSATADATGHISFNGFQADLMYGQSFTVTAEDGLSQARNYLDPLTNDSTAAVVTSITPASPIVGQTYTVLATVTDTTTPSRTVQGGTVAFQVGGLVVNVPLGPDGTAQLVETSVGPLPPSGAGNLPVNVTYNGAAGFNSSATSADTTLTIGPAPVQVTLSANPTVPYGTNMSVGASITILPPGALVSSALGGVLNFSMDGNPVAACQGIAVGGGILGPYNCSLGAVPVGVHSFQAVYVSNSNYTAPAGGSFNVGSFQITKLTLPSFDLVVTAPSRVFSQTGSCPDACDLTAKLKGIDPAVLALPANASGTIQFQIDGTNFGSAISVVNLAQQFTVSDSAATTVGPHIVSVIFSGNNNINGVTNSVQQTIALAPTSTVLSMAGGPNFTVGAPITVDAVVSTVAPAAVGPVVSLGTVSFFLDGASTPFATVTPNPSGIAGTTLANLPVTGSPHTITATFSGTGTYAGSASNSVKPNVQLMPTTTVIGSATNPSTFGNPVSFKVIVTPVNGTPSVPSGTVLIKINGGLPGYTGILTTDLSTGSVIINIPAGALPVGPLSVSASYPGDANFSASSGTVTQTVNTNIVGTVTTITPPSTTALVYGQAIQLPATVSTAPPSTLTPPLGNVTYNDSFGALPGVSSFSSTINAVYLTNTLLVGTHSITATYLPPNPQTGNTFTSSTSAPVVLTVAKAATSITLVSPTNGTFKTVVTVNAPGGGIPTGLVAFKVGASFFGYASLTPDPNYTGGVQQFLATWIGPPVNGSVTATYSGDPNFQPSTSLPVTVVSNEGLFPSGVTVSSSVDPATIGQAITYTAAVGGTRGIASGVVQFLDGATVLGSAGLDALGRGTLTTSSLSAGGHNITAIYGGDVNYAPSTSPVYGQQVNKLVSSITLSSGTAAPLVGQAINLTVALGPAAPTGYAAQTGTVTVTENGAVIGSSTAVAPTTTVKISGLLSGTHLLTAQYSGDGTWFGINSNGIAVTVGRAATTTSMTSAPAPASSQIILTATVASTAGTPTGTVNFVDSTSQAVVATATLVSGVGTALVRPGNPAIVAMYLGDSNFQPSNSGGFAELKALSAASGTGNTFAPSQIVSLFGNSLATSTASGTPPLNTTLGGTTVGITDASGNLFPAKLYYASPTQVNFVMPPLLASGPGVILISTGAGANFTVNITIAQTAPGIFTANGTGAGVAAGLLFDAPATGQPVTSFTANCTTTPCSATPIVLNSTDAFYLELFGTGVSNAAQGQVTATVKGVSVPVTYAGAQSQFPGVDQINIGPLPLSLKGAGAVDVIVTVNGGPANTVSVTFQ